MLQQEFEERVKMHVSYKEYEAINEVYNNSDLNKDEYNIVFMSDGHLKNYGKWNDRGECLLFPSSGMRDWEKFCWKRGDVVTDREQGITAMFDGWASEYYVDFNTIYSYEAKDTSYNEDVIYPTDRFVKMSDGDRLRFIAYLEKEYHGKFNVETLEVERSFEPRKGDFAVFTAKYADGSNEIAYTLIYKGKAKGKLEYYAAICPKLNNKCQYSDAFVMEMPCFIDVSLRLATETERAQLLSTLKTEGWKCNAEKYCLEPDFSFMPFERVLGRDNDDDFWTADFFSYLMNDFSNSKELYVCVGDSYYQCIPYKGNESLLGTKESYTEKAH